MKNRRHARECALQLLFQIEANPSGSLDETFADFWHQRLQIEDELMDSYVPEAEKPEGSEEENRELVTRLRTFSEGLVRGVMASREQIDAKIVGCLKNWDLRRLGGVERNVLRMAVFELLIEKDVPPVVCINEAVDLAKFFSNTESGRFVNGVLDRLRYESQRDSGGESKNHR